MNSASNAIRSSKLDRKYIWEYKLDRKWGKCRHGGGTYSVEESTALHLAVRNRRYVRTLVRLHKHKKEMGERCVFLKTVAASTTHSIDTELMLSMPRNELALDDSAWNGSARWRELGAVVVTRFSCLT